MTKEAFFKSNAFKILAPMFLILCIIKIVQGGYHTGQWLYELLN